MCSTCGSRSDRGCQTFTSAPVVGPLAPPNSTMAQAPIAAGAIARVNGGRVGIMVLSGLPRPMDGAGEPMGRYLSDPERGALSI